ncbi:MAG: Ig-like domain-containing protein [Bacilli bacterium]|nr:Ig-like domain-containing protein [Bacilli bacterium]
MNKNFFKKCKKLAFLFLSVTALAACGNENQQSGTDTDKQGETQTGYKIQLGRNEMNLVINTSERLSFDFTPDIPDDYTVTWTSSDESVAKVSSSGMVTGLKYGTATITATMFNGEKDTCVVTVGDPIDYVASLKLDMNSNTKKAEVTTELHVDGDTTHFKIDKSYGYKPAEESGVLKARYLAVDTPESTGRIEPWGKKASKFTKDIVTKAHKIIVESDDDKWNLDSTSARALVWVWYQMNEGDEFKCLNIELLQNGLAKPKNTGGTRYGKEGTAALNQAKAQKLYIHDATLKDPDYYYGKCQLTTLKDIRTHLSKYLNTYVSFDCTISKVMDQTVYLEDYDETDGINYGMQLFLGYTQYVDVKAMTYPNYRIRVAGSLQYYEAGGTYQISDPQWDSYHVEGSAESFHLYKTDAQNTDQRALYPEYNVTDFASKRTFTITEEVEEEDTHDLIEVTHDKEFKLGELVCSSSAELKNLTVTSTYTTSTGNSKGAISLTCKDPLNNTFVVRTEVLTENGVVVTADRYANKTIDVKGIVDYYNGSYQLRVLSADDIVVKS